MTKKDLFNKCSGLFGLKFVETYALILFVHASWLQDYQKYASPKIHFRASHQLPSPKMTFRASQAPK